MQKGHDGISRQNRAAAMVFCLTGLLLLQLHAPRRPATWPVVGLGFVIPMLLLVLFIHS